MEGLSLELEEQTAIDEITKAQPAISGNLRLTGLCGFTKEGSFFSGLEFLRPNFVISELSVEIAEGSSGKGYRGGVQYQDLTLVDFDPPMGKASLRGFWGRSRDGTKGASTDGIWRLGAIWGDLEALAEEPIATDVIEDIHEEPDRWIRPTGVRAGTETSNITKDQFTLTAFTWQGFAANYIRASWMKIPSNPAAQFQLGRVNTTDIPRQYNRDRGGLPDVISFYVSFSTPYKTPPTVLSWFTHIDMIENANTRLFTSIKNVTTNGFLLTIETWQDTQIGWLAYNPIAPGIASGTQDATFIDVPAKKVSFAAGTFKKAPQMFVGFRHLDVDQSTPVRLQAQASNVTATDFDIASGSWSRPGMPAGKVWCYNLSWLAIE